MAILARLKIFLTEELQTHSRSEDFKMECQWTAKRCSLIGILSALISLNFSIYNVELLNLKLYYVKSFLLRYFLSKLRLHRNILILNRYSVNLLSLKEDFLFGSKHLAVQKLVLINFTRNNFWHYILYLNYCYTTLICTSFHNVLPPCLDKHKIKYIVILSG